MSSVVRSFIVLGGLLCVLWLGLHDPLWALRRSLFHSSVTSTVLPPELQRALSLDHRGMVANYQMLRLMSFYGDRQLTQSGMDADDWRYLESLFDVITNLDPQFKDAYLLGHSLFFYDANNVDAAIRLMEKGVQSRPNDWQMHFFLGASYMLGKQDNPTASIHLRKAALLPGCPDFVAPLASRLSYYAGKTETSILFLKGVLLQTGDPVVRNKLEVRMKALEAVLVIEKAVRTFYKDKEHFPKQVGELLSSGYLERLPEEPYGGEWRVLPNGRIYSTSRFATPIR